MLRWLFSVGFGQHATAFVREEIDCEVLLLLQPRHLKHLLVVAGADDGSPESVPDEQLEAFWEQVEVYKRTTVRIIEL